MARILTPLIVVAITPGVSKGQAWVLDAYAGRATYDAVAADVGTANGVLGVRYSQPTTGWFSLSAAAPFSSEDPIWGATGLGRRLAVRSNPFATGIDLALNAHAYRYSSPASSGTGGTLQILPFVSYQGGRARVEVTSGVTRYATRFAGETQSRTLHASAARASVQANSQVIVSGETRYLRGGGATFSFAGASARADLGVVTVDGSVGRWLTGALPDVAWSAGATLHVQQSFDFWASLRRDVTDPLYWNESRQNWTIGVTHRIGGRAAVEPSPDLVRLSPGRVTIRIPRKGIEDTPSVAGDFSGWRPIEMTRAGDFWTATLALEPGYHQYAFISREGRWFVPPAIPGRRDDGFGGVVAILLVP